MNPLLQNTFSTPFETIPFAQIKPEHFEPAIIEAMKMEDEEIERIVSCSSAPSFSNTIEALERSGAMLERATTVLYNLLSADTSDILEEVANRLSPLITEHGNRIMQNEALFARVKYVYENHPPLSEEETMLLEKTYEGFERSGVALSKEGKQRFSEISVKLSTLTLNFSQNHLKDTNSFFLHITDEKDLQGLPETHRIQAAAEAEARGLEGWVITLQAPSYGPFMMYAQNRLLRKQLYEAYATLCTHENDNNNFENVRQITNLRRQLAQLLGYETFAEYALKRRMAQSPQHVYKLLHDLRDSYREAAHRDVHEVRQKAKEVEGDDFELRPWDFAYYSRLLKKERYDLDAEMLRPYFEFSAVKQGIFQLANTLYGISFVENKCVPVYHKDVSAYEVRDADGSYLAMLYIDPFARKSKQSGAWMTNYAEQFISPDGVNHRPQVAIVTNFPCPTSQTPSLLSHGELTTFLHEFGHSLHSIFAQTRYHSLSGTNVFWDFVELPSQFMENFALEKAFLQTFAFHYQTREPLPEAYIQAINQSRHFNAAYACYRQLSFGLLDMAYYDRREGGIDDVRKFESHAISSVTLIPNIPEACVSTQLEHIMSGGYAAGYYSYKWAEVLAADAFEYFRQCGVFSRSAAQKFRDLLLSQGGTRHPMELYKAFRGTEPSITALLKQDGINLS